MNLNHRIYIIALFFSVIVTSCKKDIENHNVSSKNNEKKALSASFQNLQKPIFDPINIPSDISLKDILNEKKKNELVHLRDSTWQSGQGGLSSFYQSDEMFVTPNNQTYIYPGCLLRGESIGSDDFVPVLGFKPLPIRVNVTFSSSNGFGTIDTASLSRSRVFLRKALLAPDFSGKQLLDFQYNASVTSYYSQSKLSFGYNVNEKRLFSSVNSSYNSNNSKIASSTSIMATFVVKNFSFDMSTPNQGELLDPSTISNGSLNNTSPVYVSSVTYGRFGYFLMETNSSSSAAYSAFQKTIKKLFHKSDETLTVEEKTIFNSCRITLYLLGSSDNAIIRSFFNPTQEGFSGFVSVVAKDFTAADPGFPISYQLRYLSDNTLFKPVFKIDYPN